MHSVGGAIFSMHYGIYATGKMWQCDILITYFDYVMYIMKFYTACKYGYFIGHFQNKTQNIYYKLFQEKKGLLFEVEKGEETVWVFHNNKENQL